MAFEFAGKKRDSYLRRRRRKKKCVSGGVSGSVGLIPWVAEPLLICLTPGAGAGVLSFAGLKHLLRKEGAWCVSGSVVELQECFD